jgi:signal transduction histidine kinase
MLIYNMGAMLFDVFALLFRGHLGILPSVGVRISNFVAFSCNYLILAAFLKYLTNFIVTKQRIHDPSANEHKVARLPLTLARMVIEFALAILVINLFYPIIYFIDSNNIYHREPYFWLSLVPGATGIIVASLMLMLYRKCFERQELIAFWTYIIFPLVALIFQNFIYGISLLNLASTTSLVLVFVFVQAQQGRRLAVQEKELTQSRISIMLSQIQPHFLYNSLNTIRYLCVKDPEEAQRAIDNFSSYLRCNLDSLKRTTPVPFDTELEHVRNYLALEKMRFDDELTIVYDIRTTAFMIPALTVQPLVENAVKYGVGKKAGGGTVVIATAEKKHDAALSRDQLSYHASQSQSETRSAYVITVTDDGNGYDPEVRQEDGRTHIGIDNVRARLKAMCNADLTIVSVPGKGTVATITVPAQK